MRKVNACPEDGKIIHAVRNPFLIKISIFDEKAILFLKRYCVLKKIRNTIA